MRGEEEEEEDEGGDGGKGASHAAPVELRPVCVKCAVYMYTHFI